MVRGYWEVRIVLLRLMFPASSVHGHAVFATIVLLPWLVRRRRKTLLFPPHGFTDDRRTSGDDPLAVPASSGIGNDLFGLSLVPMLMTEDERVDDGPLGPSRHLRLSRRRSTHFVRFELSTKKRVAHVRAGGGGSMRWQLLQLTICVEKVPTRWRCTHANRKLVSEHAVHDRLSGLAAVRLRWRPTRPAHLVGQDDIAGLRSPSMAMALCSHILLVGDLLWAHLLRPAERKVALHGIAELICQWIWTRRRKGIVVSGKRQLPGGLVNVPHHPRAAREATRAHGLSDRRRLSQPRRAPPSAPTLDRPYSS